MRIIQNPVQKGFYPLTGNIEQKHVILATSSRWQEWSLMASGFSDRKDFRNSFQNLILFARSEASIYNHPYPTTPEWGLAFRGH